MSEENTKPEGENSKPETPDTKAGNIDEKEGSGIPDTEYIKELRRENKERRFKNEQLEKEAKEAKEQAAKALSQIEELQRVSNDRIVRAELKAQAIAAGIKDIDDLKLADLSTIKIDENGDVQGAAELIKALKENKPYLFKEVTNTSTNPSLPQPGATQGKKAADMAPDEWKKDIAKYGIR
jgi:hypothetical protein